MKKTLITCILFLQIFVTVSCTQTGVETSKANIMTNQIHSETILVDELNLEKNCLFVDYATTSNSSLLALRKILFTRELFQEEIDYFLYRGDNLEQVDYSSISLDLFLTPFYINSSNEVYYMNGYKDVDELGKDIYWEGYDDIVLVIDNDSFLDFSKYGSMVALMNEPKSWILFDRTEITPNEYVLYNLDTKKEYAFFYEYSIQKFLSFNNTFIFAWDDPETDLRNLQYSVYEFDRKDKDNPLCEKALSIEVPSGADFIDYSSFSSELVWVNKDNNQIIVADISTKSPPETLLSDTIISQIHPFHTETTQGFWVIPALTTIGDDSTIYLFTWENNEIQKREYHIHPCFFEKNTFIGEQGELYLISTNYSSSTPVYQLHILNPANAVAYQTYTLETTSPLLQQNVSSMYFTKLFMNNNQILLEATANSHYHHKNEQLSGLYRIMLSD